jgi:hypothetical protein
MAVRIQKPAVNIREKLAELERPIGINGAALMATNTPQDAFSLIGAGRRNLIINGGFDVWQRGTTGSLVGDAGGYVSADRWRVYVNTSTTVTLSRQTFTAGQTEVPGNPTYYARFSWLGTVSAQFFAVEQFIEGAHHAAGDYLTISFYARTGNGENMTLGINRNFGSGGSATDTVGNYALELETYWKKFVITVPVPSLSGKTIGAGNYMSLTWYRSGTVSTYLELSNVQVEHGKVATPFEYRSYSEELALCQRYYEKSFEDTTTPSLGTNSTSFSTEVGLSWGWSGHRSGYPTNNYPGRSTFVKFRVPKRATPSVSLYGNSGGYPYIYDTTNGGRWVTTSWGVYNSKEGFEMGNEFTSQFQLFAFCHWTASAEL